jgi:DNA replication protein DnaC
MSDSKRYATGGSGTCILLDKVAAFDVDTGVMITPNGNTWNSYTDCLNSMVSGCTGKLRDIMDNYCPRCQREQDAIEAKQARDDRFKHMVGEAMALGAIPDDFAKWRPCGLYAWQSAALNECRADYHRNCWIYGTPGVGKTEVAYNVIHGAFLNGYTAAFIEAKEIAETCKQHNRRRNLETASVLVIDDMTKMYVTEYSASDLHNLLNDRNKNRRRTIVTSEVSGAKFAKELSSKTDGRYGISTIERLSWKGNVCKGIEMIGDNLRRVNHDAGGGR